jgi:hypothetical protein
MKKKQSKKQTRALERKTDPMNALKGWDPWYACHGKS